MQALQALSGINAEMAVVQQRISTGLKVSSPKDNGAMWAIAQGQRAEVMSLDAVQDSLNRGMSAVDVAMSAGESISDLLAEMKSLALSANDFPLGDPSRQALDDQYQALRKQIGVMASSADFNGVNLLTGGSSGVRALANTKGTDSIDVDPVDLTLAGALLSGVPSDLQAGLIATSVDDIGKAAKDVNLAIAKLGTGSKALETHLTFTGKLQDTLEASIGNIVDADLAREAARLEALKVRQQLAIMALQIANRQPSIILQLFQ